MTGRITNYLTGRLSTTPNMTERLKSRGVSWTLSNPYTRDDLSAHFALRDAILYQAYKEERITDTQFHQVKRFRVSYDEQLIKFTIPGTNHEVAVAFEAVTDRTAIRALNYLIGRANTELFYGRAVPMIGSSKAKSNATGPAPLQRKSVAANALTNDFAAARQTVMPAMLAQTPDVASARRKIVKRVEHAEFVAYRMEGEITSKIQAKVQEVRSLEAANPQPPDAGRRIAVLKGEINELKKLKKQFKDLDVYALTMALTALPVGRHHYDQLDGASSFVQRQVRADLTGRVPKSRLQFWKKSGLDETDEAYIKGVAGLMHKSRGEYATYCKKQGMTPERESLEDLILREAVRVSDGVEFDESAVKGATSLSTMTPALQTEVAERFDYLDRLSGVTAYFPDDTSTYAGTDTTFLAGEIASRRNRIVMDGTDAPDRRHRVFNPSTALVTAGMGGALALAHGLGLEPVRRITELGGMALASPVATGLNLLSLSVGLKLARSWWQSKDQLPYLIAGGAALTGVTMQALGTMDPTEVFQLAIENPQYAVPLLATVFSVTRAAYNYVRPSSGPISAPYSTVERKTNWGRAAVVMAVGTTLTYGAMSLVQLMYSEDEEERSDALGYLTGAVDLLWLSSPLIAGLFAQWNKDRGLQDSIERRAPGSVGKVASGIVGIVENVTSAGAVYHFAAKVCGFFSWSSAPDTLALPAPESSLVVEEITEHGLVPLPRVPRQLALPSPSDARVSYFDGGGHPICRNPEMLPSPKDSASLLGAVCAVAGSWLWSGTKWVAGESFGMANNTTIGKALLRPITATW